MRHVKIPDGAEPYGRWLNDATRFTQELYDASEDERKEVIESHEGLWKRNKFVTWLKECFHGKCWYSESKENVSVYHVDHFRPKSEYWWLAFNWTNYRISGQRLNLRKGKRFPIEEGGRKALPDKPGSENHEDNLLLDPLSEEDVALISFEVNGEAICASGIGDGNEKRVFETIDILGLNDNTYSLVDARQKKWNDCTDEISSFVKAQELPPSLQRIQSALAKKKLKRMISYEEEFSSVSRACVLTQAPPSLLNCLLIS